MRGRVFGVVVGWTLAFFGVGAAGAGFAWAAAPPSAPSPPGDDGPVVTPDTTPPPAVKAAPSGSVGVTSETPAARGYVLPIAGAPFAPERPPAKRRSTAKAAAPSPLAPSAAASRAGRVKPPIVARASATATASPTALSGSSRAPAVPARRLDARTAARPAAPSKSAAALEADASKALPRPPAEPVLPPPPPPPSGALGAGAAVLSASASEPPPTPAEAPVVARAKACIAAHAGEVARAETNTVQAVELLVADVCAQSVDAASLYLRNRDALDAFNAQSERGQAGLSQAQVDPQTGRLVNPPGVDASPGADPGGGEEEDPPPPAPVLREYAALRLLAEKASLGARVRRTY